MTFENVKNKLQLKARLSAQRKRIPLLLSIWVVAFVFYMLSQIGLLNEGLDFTEFITNVELMRRPNSSVSWQQVPPGGAVNSGDELKFDMKYEIPGGTLNDTNTLVYQIPGQITAVEASSGEIKDANNYTVGTYQVNSDGKIKMIFTDAFVQRNKNGEKITGHLSFISSVEDVIPDDEPPTEIVFNNTVITVNIDDENPNEKALDVRKKYKVLDTSTGETEFTVKVSSLTGTKTAPNLYDVMTGGLTYSGGLKVVSKNGNNVTHLVTEPAIGSKDFNVLLPDKLGADDEYTITYRAITDGVINGEAKFKNKAKATAKNDKDEPIQSEHSVEVNFRNDLLQKHGVKSEDGKYIHWTITVNAEKKDISGWQLSDNLNGTVFSGPVNMTDTNGSSSSVNLPYVFPANSKDTYTITYTAPAHQNFGEIGISNTAILKPIPPLPEQDIEIVETIGEIAFLPLEKNAETLTKLDNTTALIEYTVNIDASLSEITAGFVYEDEFKNGQYFTDEQKDSLRAALFAALNGKVQDYVLNFTDSGFNIHFNSNLAKGEKITFKYLVNAPIADAVKPQEYINKGKLLKDGHTVSSEGKIKYHPTVHKLDPKSPVDESHTNHDYDTISGKPEWRFEVMPPDSDSELTVREIIPTGLSLERLTLQIDGGLSEEIEFSGSGNKLKAKVNGFDIYAVKNENVWVITLSQDFLAAHPEKLIYFGVKCDMGKWEDTGTFKAFKNIVEVIKNDTVIGTDNQTQEITKNIYNNGLAKEAHYDPIGNCSEIPYTLKINPEAQDFLPDSDELILEDELTYYNHQSYPTKITLKPNSLKIYKLNPDGSKGDPLNEDEYSYIYEEKPSPTQNNFYLNKLNINIPDKRALYIEYVYVISGSEKPDVAVTNKAELKGLTQTGTSSTGTVHVKIEESAAGANASGITLCKVDSNNTGKTLKGAKFDLFKYNGTDYVKVMSDLTTNDKGLVTMDIDHNVAYKLVETQQPTGYILDISPYYFCIVDNNASSVLKPVDFKGDFLNEGIVIYRKNTSMKSTVEVYKKWQDYMGNPIMKNGSVEIELYKKTVIEGAAQTDSKLFTAAVKLGKYGDNMFWDEQKTLGKDTIIDFTIKQKKVWNNTSPPNLSLNGSALSPISISNVDDPDENDGHYRVFSFDYRIVMDKDVQLTGRLIGENFTLENLNYDEPAAPPAEEIPDELYGTYTVQSIKNWKLKINDLLSEEYDAQGRKLSYTYYIVEKNVPEGVSVEYQNNNGITTGVIEFINKLPKNTSYTLPDTGGRIGTVYLVGISIVMLSGALFYLKKRKKAFKNVHQ